MVTQKIMRSDKIKYLHEKCRPKPIHNGWLVHPSDGNPLMDLVGQSSEEDPLWIWHLKTKSHICFQKGGTEKGASPRQI